MINRTQIYPILNSAIKQVTGETTFEALEEKSLISMGSKVYNFDSDGKKLFSGAIMDQLTALWIDVRKGEQTDWGISRNTDSFNGNVALLMIKPIWTIKNTEYSITDDDKGTVDELFDFTEPQGKYRIYKDKRTYAVEAFIPDNQLVDSFQSETQMQAFLTALFSTVDDVMRRAESAWDRHAVLNFIGEKIHLQTTQSNKIHAVNILKEYNTIKGTALKAKDVYYDKAFLEYFAGVMNQAKVNLAADTSIYHEAEGFPYSCSPDELNVYVLSNVDTGMKNYLFNSTYNYQFNDVGTYKVIPYWQAVGTTNPFDVSNTSKIDVKIASDNTKITQDGILAVMFDKDAVMTNYDYQMSESMRIFTKGTKYHRGVTRSTLNNLDKSGVVFYVADVEAV